MYIENSDMSCGVGLLANMSGASPQEIVQKARYSDNAHIVWSNTTKHPSSARLIAYIKRNKLGSVKKSISRRNPNSGNQIEVFVWTVPASWCKPNPTY